MKTNLILLGILAFAQLNHQFREIQDGEEKHEHKGNRKNSFLSAIRFLRNDFSLTEQTFLIEAK